MQGLLILFPVFGGEKAAAKIQTVKGLRVEIFSRCARKNTTRPLTVRIVGADEIFRLRGEKAVEKFKKLCKNLKWLVIKRFVKCFFINDFLLLNGRIVHIFLL